MSGPGVNPLITGESAPSIRTMPTNEEIIERALHRIDAGYVFPDKAQVIAAGIRSRSRPVRTRASTGRRSARR